MSEEDFNPQPPPQQQQQQQQQRSYWNNRHRLSHLPMVLDYSSPTSATSYNNQHNYPPVVTCRYEYNTNYPSVSQTTSGMIPPSSSYHHHQSPSAIVNLPILYPNNNNSSASADEADHYNNTDSEMLHSSLIDAPQNIFECQYNQEQRQQSPDHNNNITNDRLQYHHHHHHHHHQQTTELDNRTPQYLDLDYNNNNNNNSSSNDNTIMNDKNNNNAHGELDRTDSLGDINNGHNHTVILSSPSSSTSSSYSVKGKISLPKNRSTTTTTTTTTATTKMPPLDMKEVIETLATLKSNGQMKKNGEDMESEYMINSNTNSSRDKGKKYLLMF